MQSMMKQAQQMQARMQKMQEELEAQEVTGTAGGGVVSVTVNGRKEVINISIKPEAVDPDDVEMLEDLVLAAVNEALTQADNLASSEMSKITGGMNLGGLL